MTGARYMLATKFVSDLVRNPQGAVFDKIVEIGSDNLCGSSITAAELRYGCAHKGSPRLLQQVEAILGDLDILPLDVLADVEYGASVLEGRPIGPSELLIVPRRLRWAPRWSSPRSASSRVFVVVAGKTDRLILALSAFKYRARKRRSNPDRFD